MKRISAGILSAAALAGLAGSTVAYAWGSTGASTSSVSSQRSTAKEHPRPSAQVARPGPVRWAPCIAPAHLEQGACVTDVVRTVVVPAPTSPSAPTTPGAPASGAAAPAPGVDTGSAQTTGEPGEDQGDDEADEPGEDRQEPGDDGAGRAVPPRTR